MRSRSTLSVFFAATLSGLLLLSSCGGSSSSRQRNIAVKPTIPTEFVRSTVCTNFYGAYQKDMAADNAAVTLKFCPDATRYELKWGEAESASFEVNANDPTLVISGSDFISKGPLNVKVFRDLMGAEDKVIASAPLGQFELRVVEVDGESRLSGTWNTKISDDFLLETSKGGAFSFRSSPLYLSYFFDQLIWFQRDRCRDVVPESESEAFNLEFKFISLHSTITGWLGRASIHAKNAQESLADRRTMFRGYNFIQQQNSNEQVQSSSSFSTFESCSEKVAPLTNEMSDEEKQKMADIAPLLRETIRKVDSNSCAANQYDHRAAAGKIAEAVPQFVNWRFSSEPDKAALEVAQFRLEMLTGGFADFSAPNEFHLCDYRAWGQEVQKDSLVPTFGAVIRTADGFTAEITNYDASYEYSANGISGSMSIDGSVLVVTGLTPDTEATVSVGTTRAGYAAGLGTVTGSSLRAAGVPEFGSVTSTADGFTVSITNYDPSFSYSATRTGGEVRIDESTGMLSVSGLSPDTKESVTIRARREGFADGTSEVTGSSLKANGNTDTSNSSESPVESSIVANTEVSSPAVTSSTTEVSSSVIVEETSTVAPARSAPDVVVTPEVIATAVAASGEKTEGIIISPRTTEVVCGSDCVEALLTTTAVADGEVSVVIGEAAPISLPKNNQLKLNVGSKDVVMKFTVTSPEGKETVVNVPVTHSSSVPEPVDEPTDSNTSLYLIIAGVLVLLGLAGYLVRRRTA
jgi:hypothetical protein